MLGYFKSLIKKCAKYNRSHQEGVTAVEFALIAPVILLLIFGIIEFAMIMYTQSLLEGSTALASRIGKTGYSQDGLTRSQTILNQLQSHAGTFIDMSKVTVTAKSYDQFDQIGDPEGYTDTNLNGQYDVGESYSDTNGNGQWDEDMGLAGYGNTNSIVTYTVAYPWSIITPVMGTLMGNNGIMSLSAVAVVKNEPY